MKSDSEFLKNNQTSKEKMKRKTVNTLMKQKKGNIRRGITQFLLKYKH